ncbi:MAG TPA: hypothetical protein VE035_01515 [Puia sp.]|nr:hypothetical protein [Puia sp.]
MKKNGIIENIGRKTGVPAIVELLAERLSGSELNSLLLEVFSKKLSGLSPAMLLKQYQGNRFVHPAATDMTGLLALELHALQFLREHRFHPIELSPAAQLGSCCVVTPGDQKKIISAIRNTEIMADATNAIALHIADGKRSGKWRNGADPGVDGDGSGGAGDGVIRYCTVHRHVRAQELKGGWHTAHFKIGCLVSSGLDTGSCGFETANLGEHIYALYHLFRDAFGVEKIGVRLWERGGYGSQQLLMDRVASHLAQHMGDIPVVREAVPGINNYYKGIQFKMMIEMKGKVFEIADGGMVDWTQRLLGNRKERLLISGFGLEVMYKLLHGML